MNPFQHGEVFVTEDSAETDADVVITEIGSTVGDIEPLPSLEAIRELLKDKEPHDVACVHVTLPCGGKRSFQGVLKDVHGEVMEEDVP